MGKIVNVTVEVFGGKCPEPLNVIVDNINNSSDHSFNSAYSFSQNFDLTPGAYLVRVAGVNPNADGAFTTVKITGDINLGPLPDDFRRTEERIIRESFYLEIT